MRKGLIMRTLTAGIFIAAFAGAALLFAGCRALPHVGAAKKPVLKIGITPDSPPIIFSKNDRIFGLEADLARELARKLDRPLQFIELPWAQQIPALLDGATDIIMSGMTITPERQVRLAFSDPYLEQGQLALVRRADMDRFGSSARVVSANANFGVQRKTTGDLFVQQSCKDKIGVEYYDPPEAAEPLRFKMIDIYIHDTPVIVWMASENEADLTTVPLESPIQSFGWGLRKTDADLLAAVNAILKEWRSDGTLDRIRRTWIPD